MEAILNVLITLIALTFLGILGLIAGVAIPGLFLGIVAPWLDRILPVRNQPDARR
jgi:hypothetical protein